MNYPVIESPQAPQGGPHPSQKLFFSVFCVLQPSIPAGLRAARQHLVPAGSIPRLDAESKCSPEQPVAV